MALKRTVSNTRDSIRRATGGAATKPWRDPTSRAFAKPGEPTTAVSEVSASSVYLLSISRKQVGRSIKAISSSTSMADNS